MKGQRGQYNRKKKKISDDRWTRQTAGYAEKMRGNAYFEMDVWVIIGAEFEQDGIPILGFQPDDREFSLLLAYTSREKAEAYEDTRGVNTEAMVVEKMPLGVLVLMAMGTPGMNIAIDRLDEGSEYDMLNVIKMKTQFDAGLRLDE